MIDTHCHLDAPEYSVDRVAVLERAANAGVRAVVVPAVQPSNFDSVRVLAHGASPVQIGYALGIHPLAVDAVGDEALDQLADALERHHDDPHLVAVGEIGLDRFVTGLDIDRQERFFVAQLKLAARYELPVIMHNRRASDQLAKCLRRHQVVGGIAHAFNGSFQQAHVLIALGIVLGFGGVMTFERSRQVRRLASALAGDALVLETDGPDLAPAWLAPGRNEPSAIAGICACLADLRACQSNTIAVQTTENACRALPRLAGLLDGLLD